jgi:hypothetical protein
MICVKCTNTVPERRHALGYRLCLPCGEAQSRRDASRRTIAPMHKSNYVLISNREDLRGINSKYVPLT